MRGDLNETETCEGGQRAENATCDGSGNQGLPGWFGVQHGRKQANGERGSQQESDPRRNDDRQAQRLAFSQLSRRSEAFRDRTLR